MIRVLLTLISCCVLSSGVAQLQSELQTIFDEFNLMGMSVLVMCDHEVQESYSFGMRDFERDLLVNGATQYRIASISKSISALGLLKLYDEGQFDLDDDVSDYLGYELRNPNFPDTPLTFRMFLTHTSSLQDGTGYSTFLGATYNYDVSPPSLSEHVVPGGEYYVSNTWRTEQPGTHFQYSNLNFGVVATLIEAISGQRFDQYMKTEILDPLDISGAYNVQQLPDIDQVAVLYRNQGGWTPQADQYEGVYPTPLDLSNYIIGSNGLLFAPQGGLRISALDLSKLMGVFMGGGSYNGVTLISETTMNEMLTPEWIYNGSNGNNYYGLFREWGLGIQQTTNTAGGDIVIPNTELWGHPGEAYGLISDMYFDPATGNGLIFITNGSWYGYAFGDYSAYYTLEEAVFSAVAEEIWGSCFTGLSPIAQQPSEFSMRISQTSDALTITFTGNTSDHTELDILDLQGRIVYSQDSINASENLTLNIPIGDLSIGTYVIRSRNGEFFTSDRFVVN